jgi:hypothetical protein
MELLLKTGWLLPILAIIILLIFSFRDFIEVLKTKGSGTARLLLSIALAIGGSVLPYYYAFKYSIPLYIDYILILWAALLLSLIILTFTWLLKYNRNKRTPFSIAFIHNNKGIDYCFIHLILICLVISFWVKLYRAPEIIELKVHSYNAKTLFDENIVNRLAYYKMSIKNNYYNPVEVFTFTLYSNNDSSLISSVKSFKDEESKLNEYRNERNRNQDYTSGMDVTKTLVQSSSSETIDLLHNKFGFNTLYNNPIYATRKNIVDKSPVNKEIENRLHEAGIFNDRFSNEEESEKLYWRAFVKVVADNIEFTYIFYGEIMSYPNIINNNILLSGLYIDYVIFDPKPFINNKRRLDYVAGNVLYADFEPLPIELKGIYCDHGDFMIYGNKDKMSDKYWFGKILIPDTIGGYYVIAQKKHLK